jgi:hypothetical protein
LQDYKDVIEALPEVDNPRYFGLPLNIDRSSQIVVSNQVIAQLKILKRSDIKLGQKFDKETVKHQFKPIYKLWEALKKVIHFMSNHFNWGWIFFSHFFKRNFRTLARMS